MFYASQCLTHSALLACRHSFAESMELLKQKEVGEPQLGTTLDCVDSASQMAICVLWPL